MTKISTLSDQPFSFSPWNRIFGVKNHNFFEPGQNIVSFASATERMDTFLFEMSMKWMFTFKNFRNVYWHGKTHSLMMEKVQKRIPTGISRDGKQKLTTSCIYKVCFSNIKDHIEANHLEGISLSCDVCDTTCLRELA